MGAGVYNLTVEQGATKTLQVIYQDTSAAPIDLTGYDGRGQIRLKPTDAAPIGNFLVTVSDATGGVVDIVLPSTALVGVTFKGADYSAKTTAAYDIELYTTGDADVIRLLNGKCLISPEVTK
jgi:hypothetical protein